jgi:hypothetical protein
MLNDAEGCHFPLHTVSEGNGLMNLNPALAEFFRNVWLVRHLCKHLFFSYFSSSALALDKVSPYNWLDDNFWMDKAYLEWRAPLLVNSNWWLAFADDPVIPKSALSGETNDNRVGTTFWQLRRASWLLHRMLQFRDNALST